MAKPNYQFEKRQKELAKKRKKEEKRLRKQAEHGAQGDDAGAEAPGTEDTPPADTPI